MTPPPEHRLSRILTAPARRAWRALLVLLLAATAWLAWSPHPPPAADTGWDKANHGLAFLVLALVALLAFRGARHRGAACAAALLAWGALIEAGQTWVPGRSGEWPDLFADAAGIGLALLLARWARI